MNDMTKVLERASNNDSLKNIASKNPNGNEAKALYLINEALKNNDNGIAIKYLSAILEFAEKYLSKQDVKLISNEIENLKS